MDMEAEENKWLKVQVVPKDQYDLYNTCGPFESFKNNDSPVCKCFKGYEPKSIGEWSEGDWTSNCIRRAQFQYEETITSPNSDEERKRGDIQVSGMKLPDFSHYLLTWDKMEWENNCLKNCSCLAYAYVDGIGCMIWGKELNKRRMLTGAHIAIIVSATFGLILIILSGIGSLVPFCIASKHSSATNFLHNRLTQGNSSKLLVFSFKCIETTTKNFCYRNKHGEGRFGLVYKGILADGQEVTIKRLWRSLGQDIEEFKNEVTLISRLQHRNLVKLMGFCIHREKNLMIYEYMSNRSLDVFILGIARGLLNLHRDLRLKIIHRDLKTSNILLDEDVNPKISDFGMARIFGWNQTVANTNKIAGSYGYMSFEYAIQGIFFEKSDVFSFGVILLEIISSKRNNNYCHSEDSLNLPDQAWQMWNEGKILEFPNPNVVVSRETPTQVIRCIIVIGGIALCARTCNDTVLPSPKRSAYSSRGPDDPNISPCSRNSISISNVQGRQLQFIY
ncbi:hypothetical protein H5410_046605 [Solanum commersonii]|uniref:non-specific serine/threonine protein kinase n=1 Tax=Solanum commersonii TaxID=4109 RepID=A0A9J5XCQ7_SOLCO|nr:hypothetical protein H5410_046605 [Solanum commersonii]